MKASAARDIVLAHAMETSSANDALPDARRCAAITQECLHALGDVPTEGAAGRKGFEKFLQLRAGRIIAASQLPPAVLDELVKQAKALGFATDRLIWVKQDRDDA